MTNNKFAVVLPSRTLDTNGFYKQGLVDLLLNKFTWLTIAGFDEPDVKHGIEYAGPGSLLTFGTAKNHDVNWIKRPDYARGRGIVPIYDLVKDYNTVIAAITAFANARKPRPVYNYNSYCNCNTNDIFKCGNCGALNVLPTTVTPVYSTPVYCAPKVKVFDNFVKVGYEIASPAYGVSYTNTPCYVSTYTPQVVSQVSYLKTTLRRIY